MCPSWRNHRQIFWEAARGGRNRDDPQTGPPEHTSLNFFHKLGTIHNLRQLHIPRDLSARRSSKLDDKNLVD